MATYSRLQRRQNNFTEKQVILLVGVSIVLVIVIFYFGIQFIFGLTSQISGLQHKNTGQTAVDLGLAPNAPTLSQAYSATSSADIKVDGVADPKTSVELFQNDRSLGLETSSDQGNFSFDVSLEKGANTFVAVATSAKGKKSDKSRQYSVNFVTGSPKLELSTPADGDTVKDSPIVVSGKTDSGNSVTVNDHIIVVGDDGSFSYYLNLNDGDNHVKIIASDIAGNKTTKEMTIKLQK